VKGQKVDFQYNGGWNDGVVEIALDEMIWCKGGGKENNVR
jgi:hypothetical protein